MIPEFSAVVAGIQTRPLSEPEVWREVCIVTKQGREHSPAVGGFLAAVRNYPFPESRFKDALE
jgi:LysR family transcriptional regulator, hydrogen peroxide-inducible genes activator